MHDGNKYEYIDISQHPQPTDTSLLAAKVRWYRWLFNTKEGLQYLSGRQKGISNESIY